jgi:gliding motility-associated-like protein
MSLFLLKYALQCTTWLRKTTFLIFLSLFLLSNLTYSQQVTWGFNVGGASVDNATGTHIDVNGNVYFCGAFSGNNIDFDPSLAGTALQSSNGQQDGFVAKYTANGQYLLSIAIGGSNLDKILSVTTDQAGNIYVTGFFRGANVDFDPGPAQFLMTSNGDQGGDPGYGGDIFVAKYSANGQFVWAFHVGNTSLGDSGNIIKSDAAGNLFVGGYFRGDTDFDPGAGVHNLNAGTGTLWLARYDTNGQYVWAFNYGAGDIDNAVFDLRLDATDNVYVTGYFQGTNRDFDPSAAGTAMLNSNGGYDIFVAKYTANGQYIFAFGMGGPGNDVGRGVILDNTGGLYVLGDFTGTNVDFDPSAAGTANLTSNGNGDVFVAKYTTAGAYTWAFSVGSPSNEFGWKIDLYNGSIFITGGFNGTADFNPSAATDNLTSNGGYDIFLAKYDLAGNYQCAFNIGSNQDDFGNDILIAGPDRFYLVGGARGTNVDFDPSSSTFLLSSKGTDDAFMVKYYWPPNTFPDGTIQATRSCLTGISQLIYTSTTGTSPFTVTYTDGVANYTQANVQNGVPFNTAVNAAPGTVFTLVKIQDGVRCSPVNNTPLSSAVVPNEGTSPNFDFAYDFDACDPLNVRFEGMHLYTGNFYWEFGDGNTLTGTSKSSAHTYAATGVYTIRYALNTGFCKDTLSKTISIDIIRDNIVLTLDTTICYNTTKQLLTVPSLGFCWTPGLYLDNNLSPQPTTSTPQDITYFFQAKTAGTNLVVNGDFSQGPVGFTSEYANASSNASGGMYTINTNPKTWDNAFAACVDHTTGNANMMIVNGSSLADVAVWKQTVTVTPNTNYVFATWIESLVANNPSQLQFAINGNNLGPIISGRATTCAWNQFYSTWNSGNNTSVVISIINKNTAAGGNDFALDDISFAPVFIKKDSVKISVDKPFVKANADTTVCIKSPIPMFVSGAQTYVWTPAAGLSNTNTNNPVAVTDVPTAYIVEGTNVNGCKAKDTVNVDYFIKPATTITQRQLICRNTSVQLQVTGGTTYSWAPAATLDNPASNSPMASPLTNTLYHVTITDAHSCPYPDSVQVDVRPDAIFGIKGGGIICQDSAAQLTASGGQIYAWAPANGLSNPAIANPVASPVINTNYTVTITETTCNTSTVLATTVNVSPAPVIVANKSVDLDCSNDLSQLSATGGDQYSWSPSASLNNPNIFNPIARPTATTQYIVKGTNAAGCYSYDTVTVAYTKDNEGGYLMPNAFTPNGDGKNECYGIRYWGLFEQLEFSIYNRWGQRIWFTKDPSKCWDGTYKGVKQDGDVYVYVIKGKTACNPSVFRKGTFVLIR